MIASSGSGMGSASREPEATKSSEWRTFLLTTFVIIPGAAVGFVGAFGFAIWMFQLIAGPPGPPS